MLCDGLHGIRLITRSAVPGPDVRSTGVPRWAAGYPLAQAQRARPAAAERVAGPGRPDRPLEPVTISVIHPVIPRPPSLILGRSAEALADIWPSRPIFRRDLPSAAAGNTRTGESLAGERLELG